MDEDFSLAVVPEKFRNLHSEKYRREVIAEIIDYGHAAFPGEQAFRMQVDNWSIELEEIQTNRLLGCFVKVSRNRVLTFDAEPLTADEMLQAWRK